MPWTWWEASLAALGIVLLYELLRSLLVGWVRRRQEERVDRFLRENRIPSDPFRHTHRVVVKEQVLADPALVSAMVERARAQGTDVGAVERQVRAWLDEIVPQFNLLAYYRVGYRLARLFAYGLYNVRLDKASLEAAMRKVPPEAAVVVVSNHRSNADFVVSGFMLSKSVQISYAVGEWARVWPLEGLFKSFGSYFVRRGEKDPLYHRTLQSYVELVTKQGVTQAMFPEGGLSRDGRLRPPKLGLLDSMALSKRDPSFTRPLVFLPVGINYDRVLEDEVLVRETVAGDHPLRRRSPGQKVLRLLTLFLKGLWSVPANVARFFLKRLKKHGTCAIHFGEPLVLDQWLSGPGKPFLPEADRHRRHAMLRPLAGQLMDRIGHSIPVTPVAAVSAAMVRIGLARMDQGVETGAFVASLRTVMDDLARAKAPFFTDNPYERRQKERQRLDQSEGRHELDAVHLQLEEGEDLQGILDLALDVMARRRLLVPEGTRLRVRPERWPLVEYYANSLERHLPGPGTPAPAPAQAPSRPAPPPGASTGVVPATMVRPGPQVAAPKGPGTVSTLPP